MTKHELEALVRIFEQYFEDERHNYAEAEATEGWEGGVNADELLPPEADIKVRDHIYHDLKTLQGVIARESAQSHD